MWLWWAIFLFIGCGHGRRYAVDPDIIVGGNIRNPVLAPGTVVVLSIAVEGDIRIFFVNPDIGVEGDIENLVFWSSFGCGRQY
jgi:hypothetical protein